MIDPHQHHSTNIGEARVVDEVNPLTKEAGYRVEFDVESPREIHGSIIVDLNRWDAALVRRPVEPNALPRVVVCRDLPGAVMYPRKRPENGPQRVRVAYDTRPGHIWYFLNTEALREHLHEHVRDYLMQFLG